MSGEAELLAALPRWAFGFALVLARVGTVVMLLPGFGDMSLPQTVRAGLAMALSILLLPGLIPVLPAEPAHPFALAAILGAEILAGGILGWLARLIVLALPMAGLVMAHMLGLSSVLQPDPELGAQASVLERLLGMAATVMVLSSGLYALPLVALAGSYRVFPAGGGMAGGGGAGDGPAAVIDAVAAAFALALQLAAPFVLVGVVWQVALGLLGRLVPRLQIYFIAIPGQILGGLLLLGLLAPVLLAAWQTAVREAWGQLPGLGWTGGG